MKSDKIVSPEVCPRYTIAIVSAIALANEILLLRLFSIIQWHHFAYMIISMAMLGYGASGAFLVFMRERFLRHFQVAFISNILFFGCSLVLCFYIAQRISFNPEEMLWAPSQFLKLLMLYNLLALPFFFAANTIALSFIKYEDRVAKIYSFDLVGAGVGSLGIIILLFIVFPSNALQLLALLAISAAAPAWWELRLKPKSGALIFLLPILLISIFPTNLLRLRISPYKSLSQLLQIAGTQIIKESASPLGLITVVESTLIPLRHAPGLSINSGAKLPDQYALFTDGDGMSAVNNVYPDNRRQPYLDQLITALPYHLNKPNHVLIIGAGGGNDINLAQFYETPEISVVEINPQIIEIGRSLGRINENIYTSGHNQKGKRLDVRIAEGRGFIANSNEEYDLIQIGLLDSFSASTAGLYALNENFLYTVEALEEYISHISTNGYLAISRWLKLPPRDSLKLVATAIEALERSGIANPEKNLILIRDWQISSLLVKKTSFTPEEIHNLKNFCISRAFDVAYYPGMVSSEANRSNILREPYFFLGASALLGDKKNNFFHNYKFHIAPATDNKPYFFRFFKWEALPEILNLRTQGGMALLEWGYLILLATLLQGTVVSLVLILVPVWVKSRYATKQKTVYRYQWRVFIYFFAIGLAFLFIEITFIQKFILLLSHPLYAAAVVLASFLIFSGLGSNFSQKLTRAYSDRVFLTVIFGGIILFTGLNLLTLGGLSPILISLPEIVKIVLTILLIAPLAFFMGMPFPVALTRISAIYPWLVPWAWAVNGCASVLAAVLATLLAIHIGLTFVAFIALGFYGLAASVFPKKGKFMLKKVTGD